MSTIRLLMISPMTPCSGNFATVKRIRNHFVKNGFSCLLKSPDDFEDCQTLQAYLVSEDIGLVLAIHAFKSGKILKGGTDINECVAVPDKLAVMTQCITKASWTVAFSHQLEDAFHTLWPHVDKKRIVIIPQAVSICPSEYNIKENQLKQFLMQNDTAQDNLSTTVNNNSLYSQSNDGPIKLFTFVGGIRPVKNPLFIAKKFSEWHQQQGHQDCVFLIIGPNLDEEYFKDFMKQIAGLPGVVYIPGLEEADTHAVIRDSVALVNTSQSEGMPVAVLEAMALGTPVLVRAIPGNMAIVRDGDTGYVFHNEQDFFIKAEKLLTNKMKVQEITHNATMFIKTHHSLLDEELAYISLTKKVLNNAI